MRTPAQHLTHDVWGFIFNNVIGSLAGLLWCYIVIIQFDPRQECPTRGCWRVVWALLVWALVGVVGMPWVSVQVMRSLRVSGASSPRGGGGGGGGGYRSLFFSPQDSDSAVVSESPMGRLRAKTVELVARLELERETLSWARELLSRATGTAWSIGLYTFLSRAGRG